MLTSPAPTGRTSSWVPSVLARWTAPVVVSPLSGQSVVAHATCRPSADTAGTPLEHCVTEAHLPCRTRARPTVPSKVLASATSRPSSYTTAPVTPPRPGSRSRRSGATYQRPAT